MWEGYSRVKKGLYNIHIYIYIRREWEVLLFFTLFNLFFCVQTSGYNVEF